jgi:hypothetical protein
MIKPVQIEDGARISEKSAGAWSQSRYAGVTGRPCASTAFPVFESLEKPIVRRDASVSGPLGIGRKSIGVPCAGGAEGADVPTQRPMGSEAAS